MLKNIVKKGLVIAVIVLFISMSIIPSSAFDNVKKSSIPTSYKSIIIVDDEGDGDYTSIIDAVNNSNPGDVIEVYSGTYLEGEILMDTQEITLKGISYELGGGNDTGSPLIVRKGFMQIIKVLADNITISGFTMQDNNSGRKALYQGDFIDVYSVNGCLISNNTIQNGTNFSDGINCLKTNNVQIIDNIINNMDLSGIDFKECNNASIFGNIVSNSEYGIFIESSEVINVTKNKINGCDIGIALSKSHSNTIYLNNLENNYFGVNLELSTKNIIKHNNFINNSWDAVWDAVKVVIIQRWNSFRNSWIENYWDDWIKIGPKIIPGFIFLVIAVIPGGEIQLPIAIPLPLFQLDRRPVKKPYDIPMGV